jgi:hypothetical protein
MSPARCGGVDGTSSPERAIAGLLIWLPLVLTLSACASADGVRERTNSNLGQCLKRGQSREEVIQCLRLAGFDRKDIYSSASGISATLCAPLSQLVVLPACAHFRGNFDVREAIESWEVDGYYDGP